MKRVCAFLGGSNLSVDKDVVEKTCDLVNQCVAEGFSEFLFYPYGDWTFLCADALRQLQLKGIDIVLKCFVPDMANSSGYVSEIEALSYFDMVCVLKGRNITDVKKYLIKRSSKVFFWGDSKEMVDIEKLASHFNSEIYFM